MQINSILYHPGINFGSVFGSLRSVVLQVRDLVVMAEHAKLPQKREVLDVDLAEVLVGCFVLELSHALLLLLSGECIVPSLEEVTFI